MECDLTSVRDHKVAVVVEARVLDRVTGDLPRCKVKVCDWAELKELSLADPQYGTPGAIDMLLGADVLPQILGSEVRTSPDKALIVQNTVFGWVLSGKAKIKSGTPTLVCNHVLSADAGMEDILKKFWEIETVEQACAWTMEEKLCEQHSVETHTRDPVTGHYIVALPFKDDCELGESRSRAEIRLKQNERKLAREKSLMDKYNEVAAEYFSLGHAEEVPCAELGKRPYYLPHHGVIKESSTTTKLRVVFDASAKTSNGLSLNDCFDGRTENPG